jgi:RNA polymerase sigma-70 factor (ECF subfamily)
MTESLSILDDLALVRQIQHGNQAAMEEFYLRFAPGLHAFIRRRIREPEDVEDILAETMEAVITAIMRFKGESRVFSWLCRIASFKLADYYRRAPSLPSISLDDSESPTLSAPRQPDLETNLFIWQALHQLSHEHRRVLEAKYFSDFSIREIAIQMGRTEKAVESMLVRARKQLAFELCRLAPEVEVWS